MGRQSHIVRDTVPGKIFATSEVRRQSPPAIDFHLFDFFPLAEFLVFLFNCNFSRIYYYFLLSFFWIDCNHTNSFFDISRTFMRNYSKLDTLFYDILSDKVSKL